MRWQMRWWVQLRVLVAVAAVTALLAVLYFLAVGNGYSQSSSLVVVEAYNALDVPFTAPVPHYSDMDDEPAGTAAAAAAAPALNSSVVCPSRNAGPLAELLERRARPHSKMVIVLLYTQHIESLAHSMMVAFERIGVTEVVLAPLVEDTVSACINNCWPCATDTEQVLRPFVPQDQSVIPRPLGKPLNVAWVPLTWRKVMLAKVIMDMGYTPIVVDADVIFVNESPFVQFEDTRLQHLDVVGSCNFFPAKQRNAKGERELVMQRLNTGMFFVRPTPGGMRLMDAWLNTTNGTFYPQIERLDQAIFNDVICDKPDGLAKIKNGIKVGCFNRYNVHMFAFAEYTPNKDAHDCSKNLKLTDPAHDAGWPGIIAELLPPNCGATPLITIDGTPPNGKPLLYDQANRTGWPCDNKHMRSLHFSSQKNKKERMHQVGVSYDQAADVSTI